MKIDRSFYFFLIPFVLGFTTGSGQERRMSLDEMWRIVEKQNLEIINAGLRAEKSKQLKKSAWEPGMTNLEYTTGQLNTGVDDNFLFIEQELGAPFSIGANRKYYDAEKEYYLNEKEWLTREIKKELRKSYYGWQYENKQIELIDAAILNYQKAADFATIQFQSGESNLLSKTLIESQLQDLIIQKNQTLVNLTRYGNHIRILMNSDELVYPEASDLRKLVVIVPSEVNSQLIDSIPEVNNKREGVNLADSYLKLSKAQISPMLKAGYFNQEIDKEPGFQGWQFGISFPILFHPQKARIQAASIDQSIAENEYTNQKLSAGRAYDNLINQHIQLSENLDYFETVRLANAELISDNATSLYQSGEIGYLEYVNNISVALEIKEEYWKQVNAYNQLVIQLFYFLNQ